MTFLDAPTPDALNARRRFAGYIGIALLVYSLFVLLAGYDLRAAVMVLMALVWLIASRLW